MRPLAAVARARLRSAARALTTHGVSTPALVECQRRDQWPPLLEVQVIVDVHHHSQIAAQLGVDVDMLPRPPEGAPPAGTVGGRGDVTVSEAVDLGSTVVADAASVVAPVGAPLDFDGLLDSLRGVGLDELGELRAEEIERLGKAGITSVWDVLMRAPRRYLDRSDLIRVGELRPGMKAVTFAARVRSISVSYGRVDYARFTLADGDSTVSVTFFRAAWMAKRFRRGETVLVHGDVGEWNGKPTMSSPIMEDLEDATAPMVAVYPQSQKNQVSTWLVQKAAIAALRRIPHLDDPLEPSMLAPLGFGSRLEALRALHVPQTAEDAQRGRDRLAFDELMRLQLAIGVIRESQRRAGGIAHPVDRRLVDQWISGLPYPLTGAQARAISDVAGDLADPTPMNRLLQGDVGAGKTVVLTAAALLVIGGGRQAAIVAPSEILARQHYEEMRESLEPLGVQVDLLVSRHLPRPRKQVLADLADGTCRLAVGTHSLLMDTVTYRNLGIVIIDEQHRFGVDQRSALSGRGDGGLMPDMLQATATPIPRTSAITEFGDMSVSVLDEKPPGRSPIVTQWVESADLSDADASCWSEVRRQVSQGRQAFVVCPLVHGSGGKVSETKMAAAADEVAVQLGAGALLGLRMGVVHGKLAPAQRSEVMAAFVAGDIDVLVATTVIEVGVSVPNATVMVVMDASKFGLAQLHQLRGRVGRGRHPGQCWLVGEANGDGAQRMEAMCSTDDGFVLSALDLEIRGPGSLVSTVQAGRESGLVVADLVADEELHVEARRQARALLARDPQLLRHRTLRFEVETALGDQADYLARS